VIEIENKTINHRPDLWGHFGIARELRKPFSKDRGKKNLNIQLFKSDRVEEKFEIEINTARCLHYLGLKMGGTESRLILLTG
jgi:phenylalanyl-tRNA synthetase beta chain